MAAFWVGLIGLTFLDYPNSGIALYDDAFFFTRYAEIFLQTGSFTFNAGEAPAHGNTSQFYQLLVTLVYWLAGRDPVATLLICSLAGGSAALLALLAFYRDASRALCRAQHERWRGVVACLLIVHVALSINFQFVSLSGMETGWAVALVALALRALLALTQYRDGRHACIAGLWQIAVYVARPDAAFVALAPLGALCLFGSAAVRKAAWQAASIGAIGMGAVALAGFLYYGDALPLAVFIKALPISRLGQWDGTVHEGTEPLVSFLRAYGSLLLLAPLGCVAVWRRADDGALAIAAAFAGGVVFVVLQWMLVIQVMGLWGRFYAPSLPALIVPGLLGIEMLLQWWSQAPRRIERIVVLAGLVLAFAIPAGARLYQRLGNAVFEIAGLLESGIPSWRVDLQMRARLVENIGLTPKLIAALDANRRCSIASSEDGLLATYFTHHRIVDLSLLHDREQAHGGFSAERVLLQRRPEMLIFPEPWYEQWRAGLQAHPALARDYEMVGALRHGTMPVAVRRDGPCLAPLKAAFAPG